MTIYLVPELATRLRRTSVEQERDMSAILCDALRQYFETGGPVARDVLRPRH